jgi:competence protein ComFC
LTLKPGASYHIYRLMWNGLDLLFPPTCGGCGQAGERWCSRCNQNVLPLPKPICDICGEPQRTTGICKECAVSRPPYVALRSWVVFKDPVRTALHKLKYRRDIGLGETLAWPLAEYIETTLGWDVEMIVPIPLSPQRFSERGYNQVALIARPLAMIKNWKYEPQALRRVKHTRSQVGLNVLERRDNVQNAFHADSRLINDKKVLLIDDVATTGATLLSASQSLVGAGARHVYALTTARAVSRYGLDNV